MQVARQFLNIAGIVRNGAPFLRILPQLAQNNVRFAQSAPTPYEIVQSSSDDKSKEVFKLVNDLTKKNDQGRLFAVVQVAGKQFKITSGDVIVIEGYWPPDVGDKITLDKVLLAGAQDFTLIGKPLIQDDLVKVTATVIEKALSHTKTHFRKKRRKQYLRINFYREPQTMLRINNIEVCGEVNRAEEVSTVRSRKM